MDAETNIKFAEIFAPLIIKLLSTKKAEQKQDIHDVSEAVDRHITEVMNWANTFQFVGMGLPKLTDTGTIPLDFYTEARRFQSKSDNCSKIGEKELLSDTNHYLLLGEPGSGKTTTMRRISLALLREPASGEETIIQFPIVIRLRELKAGASIYNKLCDILGLIPTPFEFTVQFMDVDQYGKTIWIEQKKTEMRIGKYKVEDILSQVLNEIKALILLDGLDELQINHSILVKKEIIELSRKLTTSKIIVSCRSGDYTTQMEGFAVTEICPLTNAQILSITEKWLGVKNEDFLKCLKNVPYFDVANRPLLLTNLLFYYKRYEYLPDQPTQIYSKLVDILLQEWDAEREIHRDSRYSGFDPTKKAEFLSLLAYKLTYPEEKAVFTEKDLIKAYLSICDRFHLPKNEATKVAREIQTHTGIISAGPQDTYEFCHLSLQEYLTAQYIVKSPLETQMTEYLCKYAAPLAVAVALSSTPSKWFGNFILQFRNLNKFNPDELNSFLSRVLVENPSFEESEILGFAIILLYRHYYTNEKVCEYLGRLIQIESVMKSTAKALRWYIPEPGNKKNTSILLKLDSSLQPVYSFTLPAFGALPRKYVKTLKNAVGSSVLFFQKVEDIR